MKQDGGPDEVAFELTSFCEAMLGHVGRCGRCANENPAFCPLWIGHTGGGLPMSTRTYVL